MVDDSNKESGGNEIPADQKLESRRKFTRTGIAGGAVLMSLMNRPALGSGGGRDAQCTASLLASWNLSAHPDLVDCKFACSPGYWKPNNHQSRCSWDNEIPGSYGRTVIFSTAFSLTGAIHDPADSFLHALFTQSLEWVINGNLHPTYKQFGLHFVAALLNSLHPVVSLAYPYTQTEVMTDVANALIHYHGSGATKASRNKSMLTAFLDKYDIYNDDLVACPLPTNACSGGGPP